MSHFYGSIQGNRGEATKGGSKDSGIQGHIRGWHIGARVDVTHRDGVDVVTVHATGGSNSHRHDVMIAEFNAADLEPGADKCRGCVNLVLNDQCAAHAIPAACGEQHRERREDN